MGERFREMVCPSLLRKEMGDLVLAIRTAFSSAFRSRASVNRKQCWAQPWRGLQSTDQNYTPCRWLIEPQKALKVHLLWQKQEELKHEIPPRKYTLRYGCRDFSLPFTLTEPILFFQSTSVTKPSIFAFQKLESANDVSYKRLLKPHLPNKNFKVEGEREEGYVALGHWLWSCRHQGLRCTEWDGSP